MTWSPIIRVFFAIEFDLVTQEALQQITVSLKKNTKKNHIRWTRPENFHITLKFIPALNTDNLPILEKHMMSLVKNYTKPILLNIGACITFPHFYRPRVIAMEALPKEVLQPLANDLTTVCDALLLTHRDNTPFCPHVTMGRIKHPKEISFNDLLFSCTMPFVPPVSVDHITLFRSEPYSEGSRYTVIKRFPLG
jgi:2'-5' RNA ligase